MSGTNGEEKTGCGSDSGGAAPCCAPTPFCGCASPSGSGPECCAPAVGATGRRKTLVFLAVMGAAVAVLAHGLMKEDRLAAASDPSQNSGRVAADIAPDGEHGPGGASPAAGVSPLDSFVSLEPAAAGNEAVFVCLPGLKGEPVQHVPRQVESAVNTLKAQGKRVAAFTPNTKAEGYDRWARQFTPETSPFVVVLGRGCRPEQVTGEVTEDGLLRAFVRVSMPASSCGDTCDPSHCGE